MSVFEQAFRIVVGSEGGFTNNAADPGNWTGRRCGAGVCAGTKFGISAASYPAVDIAGLSLEAAQAIYRRDYWVPLRGEELAPALAVLVFDAGVNNGVVRTIRWLQVAAGVTADGVLGPGTMAAVGAAAGRGAGLLAEFQAQRLLFMVSLPTWQTFGRGWARRLSLLPFEAVQVGVEA